MADTFALEAVQPNETKNVSIAITTVEGQDPNPP
jgi:hypothetical protein